MSLVKVTTKQVADLVNTATSEITGVTAVLTEDLTNVVDMGNEIQNADLYENFTNGLLLTIGKDIIVNRPYKSSLPNIYRSQTEYGQLTQKIRGTLDEASPNQSWQLTDNTSYDDNVYIESTYDVKLYSKQDAYEIRKSIPDEQLKGCFRSKENLEAFVSFVMTLVYNSIEVKREALCMRIINNMIGETIYDNNGVRYVNLLSTYNTLHSTSLTASQALITPSFLKWSGAQIRKYQKLIARYNTIFNLGGATTFTPKDLQHLILHSEYSDNMATYLESDTFHNEFVALPYHDEVPYWQGTGTDLTDTMKIDITTSSGHSVSKSYVIGVLFDHDGLGIFEDSPTVRTKYVNSSEFTNYWFKQKVKCFNDTNENCIVFTLD